MTYANYDPNNTPFDNPDIREYAEKQSGQISIQLWKDLCVEDHQLTHMQRQTVALERIADRLERIADHINAV